MHRLVLLSEPRRGAAGERLARGTGSSLEYQDRRAYQAGDDVRHVDWRALARSDQVLVRQYRAEVLPRVEIVLDPSRSMAVEEAKAQAAVDLVALLASAARGGGFECAVALAGDRPELVEGARFQGAGVEFGSRSAWPAALQAATVRLRAGALRVLVSDFLFPHDAAQLVRPLAARGGGLVLIQVLGASDVDPVGGEAVRLVDAESEVARDLVLDRRALERYRQRLARLTAGLQVECQRAGARFVRAVAGTSLPAAARALAESGVLELDG
ncbi:MAG: DUF58 domain-containing protein [Planctomycetes bacterium]|nr:DUF58 domain-containing protein [Planctomycetota bacterium]